MTPSKLLLFFTVLCIHFSARSQDVFTSPQDYPLMGFWIGQWENPTIGYEKLNPKLTAEIVLLDTTKYKIRFLPDLAIRSEPYAEFIAYTSGEKTITVNENGWQFEISGTTCSGSAMLNKKKTLFKLTKKVITSPSLGQKPPKGATTLFDGKSFKKWQHQDGRQVTWHITPNGEIETRSQFWPSNKDKKSKIGGDIETIASYPLPLQFHMEFRYPVELGKSGQALGNSGLFFLPIGEVQILNSFGSEGYWNECGAIYKQQPPMVNAAAPPLQWQTYDVEIFPTVDTENNAAALLTVKLNNILVHNKLLLPIKSDDKNIKIKIQDHINRMQFKNIWVTQLQE